MLLEIDHHNGVPIYRQVVGQVRRQIMTYGLKEGQQLESVRELAGRIKVNPMTISKAYSLLESEGLVERRRGVGLFVAKVEECQMEQIKAELFEEVLSKAAIAAVQLGVSEDEAVETFKKHFNSYHSNSGSRK
jgi:GntR family transcriptional regulator